DGMLSDAKSQSDGQAALCWIQRVGRFFFVSNTASNTLSSFTVEGGQPALLAPVAATAEMGPIDLTSPNGTRFLYAETGILGTVDEFAVDAGGALRRIGTVSGLPRRGRRASPRPRTRKRAGEEELPPRARPAPGGNSTFGVSFLSAFPHPGPASLWCAVGSSPSRPTAARWRSSPSR